jgi:hypothetical protein
VNITKETIGNVAAFVALGLLILYVATLTTYWIRNQKEGASLKLVLPVAISAGTILGLLGVIVAFLFPGPFSIAGAIIVILLTLVSIGTTIFFVSPAGKQEARAYATAFRASVAVVPLAATWGTIAAYIAFGTGNYSPFYSTFGAIAVGMFFALTAWLVATLFYSHNTSASRANTKNYNLLCEQLIQLENQHKHLCTANTENMHEQARNQAFCDQISNQLREIEKGLEGTGMPWVTGTGYIDLWHRIHRAEEALIKFEPRSEVIMGAMWDETRLSGSNMTNRDSLLRNLRSSVTMLDDSKIHNWTYVDEQPITRPSQEDDAEPVDTEAIDTKARTMLSEVRYEINNFNDDVWEGIVQARHRLSTASLFLGFTAYVLLTLAIIGGAPSKAIFWALIYFIVGATVGLFARSRAEATADTATDDFGLSTTRLIHTPLFSGLGAVGGVLIVSVLDTHFLGFDPNATNATLLDIFTNKPNLLVFAAVFGLAPDLLIQRLTQQAENYKDDLKSTQGNRKERT